MDNSKVGFDVRELMEQFIEAQYEEERAAAKDSFRFDWEGDGQLVGEEVKYSGGRWMVYLIFQESCQPFNLRRIAFRSYPSRQVAEIVGAYQRRRFDCQRNGLAEKETSGNWIEYCWN